VERRQEVSREADFYGAMDGASKFVRGDAIASMIITSVNILGGAGVGLLGGMELSQAFKTYTILTIGDGLVSQIPALIVATAGAIIVTKAGSRGSLADELSRQVIGKRRGLQLASGIVAALALVPGLPMLPFVAMAGVLFFLSKKSVPETPTAPPEEQSVQQAEQEAEELKGLLHVDQMGVELGCRLLHLVEKNQGGSLLQHIGQLRRRFASEMGILLPPVHVVDNVRLGPTQYRINIQGEEVSSGELRPGQLLAMNPGTGEGNLSGEQTKEPTFGLPATWIAENRRAEADLKGYTVVEPSSVLVTHLSEVIRNHAAELLTREDVKTLVETVRQQTPSVVDDVIPNQLTYGTVHRVLRALLQERVSIRNLSTILESLSEDSESTKDPDALAELVRRRISRALIKPYLDDNGVLKALTLDPTLERALMEVARNQESPEGPGVVRAVVDRLSQEIRRLLEVGQSSVVLVRAEIRTFVRDLVRSIGPRTAVLSYAEAATAREVEALAVVTAQESKAGVVK
jgi:flagellar biosynthesis protein FlhA